MNLARIAVQALLGAALAFPPPAPSSDTLFVTTNWSEGNEQVLLMDSESGQKRALWQGEGWELDAILSPDGQRLYLTYKRPGGDELAVIDTGSGAVLQTIETPQLLRWTLPGWPGMAISTDGRWLHLLGSNYSSGSYEFFLITFDPRGGAFLPGQRSIRNCPGAQILPLAGDGNVVVLCGSGGPMRAEEGGLVLRLPDVGYGVIDPTGQALYVALRDGPVQEVNLATVQVTRRVEDASLAGRRFMRASATLSPDGRLWYLPADVRAAGETGAEEIVVIDTETMRVKTVITPNRPIWSITLSTNGRQIYASSPDANSIAVLDALTGRHLRTLDVGARPFILLTAREP